ncbi:TRIB2 [Bugula neritina]|uniref:TRIB2 n=1 Tax=Bugula neritina TaxID=10212 RepID=A0A7J7JYJ5_BUGNE|nr:TRIB2 [Bugula neritina]
MTSLTSRRRSLNGPTPTVIIPPRHSKDEEQYETSSPTSELYTPEQIYTTSDRIYSPPTTPPISGGLSPELQPNTPPVINDAQEGILQIGTYLLVEQLMNNHVYKAVNIHTNQEKICKVFTQDNYRAKIAAYCRLYENTSVVKIHEIIQGDKFVYVFFDKNYGDLHSYVRRKKRLKEEEAVALFKQIASQLHSAMNMV